MTMYFYVLISLSTTALYLALQAYRVFQAKKKKKETSLKGRLILSLDDVIPINCITIKSIITETRKDFIGC